MDNLFNRKVWNANHIFSNDFICSKNLYINCFGTLPNRTFINNIDGEKAYRLFVKAYSGLITDTFTNRTYSRSKKDFNFCETILILSNGCVVAFDDYYCEILHTAWLEDFVRACIQLAGATKRRVKRQPAEINLIVRGRNGLELKAMEIKRITIDIDLFYENNFAEVHQTVSKRLNQKKDKGIVLLHGLPGTGKTTYLRYLAGKVKKRVLFLSPNAAANLMDPDLIEILIDNPDSVLIIEDAENIIIDRKISNDSSVSNLLNISDGLLSDFLNVQLICTFNSSLTLIDSALMRKGRLIARYEFGKLSVEKAQKLSRYFGYDSVITQPMTIAEISNQNEQNYESKSVQVMGFRREPVLEN